MSDDDFIGDAPAILDRFLLLLSLFFGDRDRDLDTARDAAFARRPMPEKPIIMLVCH